MSQRWTREELDGVLAARRAQPEGQGEHAWIDLRLRVTPELLEGMLGGSWTFPDGSVARFDGVLIDDDGYAEPILSREVKA